MDDRSPLRLIWLLLLAPYVGLLWVPFYNARTPELWGFPFFYWYQLIWVPITAALTWLVYRSVRYDD
jgi:membrane protein implicated in regulation of membrane protease activity